MPETKGRQEQEGTTSGGKQSCEPTLAWRTGGRGGDSTATALPLPSPQHQLNTGIHVASGHDNNPHQLEIWHCIGFFLLSGPWIRLYNIVL